MHPTNRKIKNKVLKAKLKYKDKLEYEFDNVSAETDGENFNSM